MVERRIDANHFRRLSPRGQKLLRQAQGKSAARGMSDDGSGCPAFVVAQPLHVFCHGLQSAPVARAQLGEPLPRQVDCHYVECFRQKRDDIAERMRAASRAMEQQNGIAGPGFLYVPAMRRTQDLPG